VDPLGLETLNEFAVRALREAEAKWKEGGVNGPPEYCGVICCNKKTEKYRRIGPVPGHKQGKEKTCDPYNRAKGGGRCEDLGPDWIEVATYHTHPHPTGLSHKDRRWSDVRQVPEFLKEWGEKEFERYDPDPDAERDPDKWRDVPNGNGGRGDRTTLDHRGEIVKELKWNDDSKSWEEVKASTSESKPCGKCQ
jgi:proteasome lid subunit RPN8/RPN11